MCLIVRHLFRSDQMAFSNSEVRNTLHYIWQTYLSQTKVLQNSH